MITQFELQTNTRDEMLEITVEINKLVGKSGIKEGSCTVFIPHTTAGITINENADPDVRQDIIRELDKIVPFADGYQHLEGNSAAHIKASLMGFSQTILIDQGRLVLGTWQGVYFCEFDGPRRRKVVLRLA